MRTRALVLGGSGALGSEIVRGFATSDVPVSFTWRTSGERARALETETNATAIQLDLRDGRALSAVCADLIARNLAPDILVHAAGLAGAQKLGDLSDADFDEMLGVGVRAAFIAIRELAPAMAASGGGDVVLCSALAGLQPARAPAHLAAAQAAIAGMARAVAKELGSKNIRVNVVAIAPLEGGISRDLPPDLLADYKRYAAMGRTGTAAEVAKAVVWTALKNAYMTGSIVPVTGGI